MRFNLSSLLILMIGTGLFSACAGPTTPFGAPSLRKNMIAPPAEDESATKEAEPVSQIPPLAQAAVFGPQNAPEPIRQVANAPAPVSEIMSQLKPKISFLPKRQNLHSKSKFTVIIEDPFGIPKDYELMIIYNGIDMTRKFLSQADVSTNVHFSAKMKLTFNHLRLPPTRDHNIEVVYWRYHTDKPVFAKFVAPQCSAFKPLPIFSTGEFLVSPSLVEAMSRHALTKKINPAFVAGLVAQESGFNAQAVSFSKALGLTQITTIGEEEVTKTMQNWPRYLAITEMTPPIVKMKIMSGKINARNEWRLNPDYSIQGGVEYLNRLGDYWHRQNNMDLVSHYYGDQADAAVSQLILASYNSGATRVNQALQNHGRRWLRDDKELGEARKYVARVLSYCDTFSTRKEELQEDEYAYAP